MLVPLIEAVSRENLQFRLFDERLQLREVILGPKCDLDLLEIRSMISEYRGVRAFKSRLAWNHFKVVPVESSVP